MKNMKLTHWFMLGIIAFAGVLMTLLIFWMLYPYNPIDFEEIQMDKRIYRVGEPLEMRITYCKHVSLPADTTRQFIDGVIFTLPPIIANSPAGCGSNISKDVFVPEQLEPGEYVYRQTMIYQMNPIREVVVVFETPRIEVVE